MARRAELEDGADCKSAIMADPPCRHRTNIAPPSGGVCGGEDARRGDRSGGREDIVIFASLAVGSAQRATVASSQGEHLERWRPRVSGNE